MTPRTRSHLTVVVEAGSLAQGQPVACEAISSAGTVPWVANVGEPSTIELAQGTYLVRAKLPTGPFLSRSVRVGPGDQEAVLSLHPAAPRGTQTLIGGLAAFTEPFTEPFPSPLAPAVWGRLWQGDLTASADATASTRPDQGVEVTLDVAPGMYAYQFGGERTAWRMVCLPPSYSVTVAAAPSPDRDGFDDGLRVEARGASMLAGSLLAYLQSGQLGAAASLADDLVAEVDAALATGGLSAEAMAAAGYFLLRAGRAERLGGWVDVFLEAFDWLPDAHVLAASVLLQEDGVPDGERALHELLTAASRGVPRYTEGLRLLLDGLGRFRTERHTAAEEVQTVRRYAAACDWSAVHTTYWAARPGDPTLEQLHGLPYDGSGWQMLSLPSPPVVSPEVQSREHWPFAGA